MDEVKDGTTQDTGAESLLILLCNLDFKILCALTGLVGFFCNFDFSIVWRCCERIRSESDMLESYNILLKSTSRIKETVVSFF